MNTGGTGKYERLAGCTPESVGIPKRGERWDTLNFGINRPSKADISRGRPVAQGETTGTSGHTSELGPSPSIAIDWRAVIFLLHAGWLSPGQSAGRAALKSGANPNEAFSPELNRLLRQS